LRVLAFFPYLFTFDTEYCSHPLRDLIDIEAIGFQLILALALLLGLSRLAGHVFRIA
jgi:hypothetical protein